MCKCTLLSTRYLPKGMATRQHSSNGKQKSPRIQVVLPEELCEKLSKLAERESRTVSNMAKVLIQEGIQINELSEKPSSKEFETKTQDFINTLEKQKTQRLKGITKRLKFKRN